MKTKFPFKYNKVAALMMLAPVGMANAAAPYFLESSAPGTDFELLFTVHDSASSSMLLDIDDNNNVHLGFTSDNDSVPRYAKYEDGVVTSIALDASSNAANGYPTVLVNPAIENGLVAVYIQDGVVKVATSTDNGTSWTISANTMPNIITTDGQTLRRIRAGIDSQGKMYVTYNSTGANVIGELHINSYDTITDSWASESGDSTVAIRDGGHATYTNTDNSVDIVIADDDTPFAIYRNNSGHYIDIYTPNDDGVWVAYRVSGGTVPTRLFRGTYHKVAIDNDGAIYILNATTESAQNVHADVFKVDIDYENNSASGSFYAESILDKLTVTPNSENGESDTALPNTLITSLSRPVFDSNNNMFFVFNDPTVTDTKDFIVARIDAETGDVTRLNNNYTAVTGEAVPTAGFNTVDLAIGDNDLPVVVFNEGTPTVMRLGLTASGESLSYLVFNGNNLSVGDLTGIDADGDAITYSITDDGDGSGAALFEVDAATNQLKLKAPIVENNKVYNLTVEATAGGESTSVNIQVTVELLPDADNDGTPDIYDAFPNDASEQVDTDGDGIGDNIDPAPENAADITAPVISFVNEAVPLVINATGLTSELSSTVLESFIADNLTATDKITPTDNRNGDVDIVIVSDLSTPLASGINTIQLSATDSSENIQNFEIEVYVNPVVQVGTNLIVETEATLSVPVNLKGLAPAYPVVLNYTVTPSNTGITSEILTASFEEGDVTEINYDLSNVPEEERLQAGESISIEITEATNAAVMGQTIASAEVVTGNFAPMVTMSLSQLNEEGTYANSLVVAGSAGNVEGSEYVPLVKVTANITDVNMSDTHCITYTSPDGELIEYVEPIDPEAEVDPEADSEAESVPATDCNLSNSFIFDPSNLDSGFYQLELNVVENHSLAPFTVDKSITFLVVSDATVILVDSNQNGIPDLVESTSAVNDSTLLNIVPGGEYLQVPAGVSLSLGDIAGQDFTTDTGYRAAISEETVDNDFHFMRLSEIINFNVDGLQQAGDSVSVVIPLADGVVIPADAVYRKYTEQNGDWFDFVVDDKNQIASALKDAQGNCPAPESISYVEGLIEGNDCIQLTIEDGGLNDGDSMANGTVVDPGVLAVELENNAPEIITLENHSATSGEQFTVHAVVSDAEEDAISYTWTQLDTDAALTAEIVDANAREGVFIAPDVAAGTELTFSLTINDGYVDSEPKEFTVRVETINHKPEHEVDRKSGSFGWIMGLFTLAGLVARRKSKRG
jgi:hypothetical protein